MNEWHPASEVENYNPLRYQFVWNEDYSLFQAIPLRWWDDSSYIRYQGDNWDTEDWNGEE